MIEIRLLRTQDDGAYSFLREKALEDFPSSFGTSNAEEQPTRKSKFDQVAQDPFDFHLGCPTIFSSRDFYRLPATGVFCLAQLA